MADTSFQTIVVGVGAMGSAALAHLAARGVRALGIEQHALGHALGSSHGHSRVIRKAYFEDPRYVPLLQRSYALWRSLEEETGQSLIVPAGCLNFGPGDHPSIQLVLESARRHALLHEVLDEAEIRARWPALRPNRGDVGVLDPEGGIVPPERCVLAHAGVARARGALIHEHERVVSIHPGTVETDRARYACETVIVTQGPWIAQHGMVSCPIPLRVMRQVQLWFAPRAGTEDLFALGRFPVFIHFLADRAYYGMPRFGQGSVGGAVKVCRHHGGPDADPETLDRIVRDEDVEDVRGWIRVHAPDADGPLVHGEVCMYTNTPDENFVVGPHPELSRVILAAGFSGHGFKLAPVIGEILADLALEGRTAHDISFFSPTR